MFDRIEKLGGSLVQYGPYNDRIYLMKLDPLDLPQLPDRLFELAKTKHFSKIFIKIPADLKSCFDDAGYRLEALVPRMLGGEQDAAFMGLYLDESRAQEKEPTRVSEILELARAKAGTWKNNSPAIPMEEMTPKHSQEMAEVYKEVFASYPFPIHDPDYLKETMESHVRYFGIREGDKIIALSSAEMDPQSGCVEMTDFATLPPARGRSLAVHLLAKMEETMQKQGNMYTAYTIARSLSPGMNITFAKKGYTFAGTLTNNTNISGHIESMNVWYKHLCDS